MSATPDRVEELFNRAVALGAGERPALLDRECGDDPALRRRVDALLSAHEAQANFLPSFGPPQDGPPEYGPPGDELTLPDTSGGRGDRVGPYKILQRIGEGGFGVVYMAEQVTPVRRRVALKVIKPGMDSRQVIARFEAERQALAIMDHPNVARVFDAGATDAGRPYFAMELVGGVPITEYCDRRQLGVTARLELFAQVCHAVQHAHQKGLIHRDLKPSNVLVATHDDRPVAKVIDFGIAKAMQARLTEKTLFTEFRQMIGTPEYMSPEQAEGSLDIDTRSDVYSMGVLLYELLTGATPFDPRELRSKAYAEIQRIIREVEPPRPSTRLSGRADLASVAALRGGVPPHRLHAMLQGELDWVVMRCLEKDRARRYPSVAALAADVAHYLADEPVQACPPSAWYRLRKTARRHRAALLAGALVAGALVAGTVVSTWQAFRASRAGDVARANEARAVGERNDKEAARRAAAENARRSQAVSDFLVRAFSSPDPERAGASITIAETLDRAVTDLEQSFRDDPLVRAALLEAIGASYRGLGLYDKSIAVLENARDLRAASLGPNDPLTLDSTNQLAWACLEKGDMSRAITLYEATLAGRSAALGPDARDTLIAMDNLGWAYQRVSRLDEAIKLKEPALRRFRDQFGADDPDTLKCMTSLASAYVAKHRPREAVPLLEEALKRLTATRGPTYVLTLQAASSLGVAYQETGQPQDALKLQEATVGLLEKELPPGHPRALLVKNNLAAACVSNGRPEKAVPLFEQVLAAQQARLDENHHDTLMTLTNLAVAYDLCGHKAGALITGEEAVERMRADPARPHPNLPHAMVNLARFYQDAGQFDQGLRLFDDAVRRRAGQLGATNPTTLETMAAAATAYWAAGQMPKAISLLEEALRGQRDVLGDDDPATLHSMNDLGMYYLREGRREKAVELLEESLRRRLTLYQPGHPKVITAERNLAAARSASPAATRPVSSH